MTGNTSANTIANVANDQLPPPDIFGLPYNTWRQYQSKAVEDAIDSPYRVTAQVCPTGFGKSLMYMATALLQGGRTVILTSTKALQSQLLNDFSEHIVDIRGRNAYNCNFMDSPWVTAEDGPCKAGLHCMLKDMGECDYYNRLEEARAADIVVTNYACWMSLNKYTEEGLGHFDTIVCDEAHNATRAVEAFISIEFDKKRSKLAQELLPIEGLLSMSNKAWGLWATTTLDRLDFDIDELKSALKVESGNRKLQRKYRQYQNMQRDVAALSRIDDTWVVDISTDLERLTFSPLWAARYCESYLFCGVSKVILTSAFICAKTAEMLGVTYADYKLLEYPHSFPLANRRVTHIPTVRMNWRTDNAGLRLWVSRIDQIIGQRLDRKGIVHTTSYKRRDFLMANSRYRDAMMSHAKRDTFDKVEAFKRSKAPKVLISPSITTGYDFPYATCEYQIIGKLSYPDGRNKITKARMKADKDYGAYIAMQELVQAAGRGVRASDDHCETFIIDDNITWFMGRHREFAPAWFMQAYQKAVTIPRPPVAMGKG